MRPNRIARWLCLAVMILILANGFAWVAAKALIVNSPLAHADALVVLAGSSTFPERTRHAAKLLHEGRAPLILLTNDNQKGGWSIEEERNPYLVERAVAELRRQGVSSNQIAVLPGIVSTTHDEAVSIREYADAHSLRSVLVVTSAYQSRRALWTMQRVFRERDIEIGLDAVEPGEQSPHPTSWWCSRLGWKMVPGEYLKILYYRLKY